MKSHIEIPCHWNLPVLQDILRLNEHAEDVIIDEIYGSLPSTFGHGRAPDTVSAITIDEAKEFRHGVSESGLSFSYLINAHKLGTSASEKDTMLRQLDQTLEALQPDSLVIASHEMMKLVRDHYKDIPIYVSTIARVTNSSDVDKYSDIKPKKIIVQHDVNRDFDSLKSIVDKCADKDIDVVLMLTESCLSECPYMINHYDAVGRGKNDESFHQRCNTTKIKSPREFLKANFIRPEDLCIYESMGITSYKITGRSKPAEWLPLVAESYLHRSFDGNLVRLLGIDPKIQAEGSIYIDNKSLDGFLKNFPRTNSADDENGYCDYWVTKLFKEGKFIIKDVDYRMINDSLKALDATKLMTRWYGGS